MNYACYCSIVELLSHAIFKTAIGLLHALARCFFFSKSRERQRGEKYIEGKQFLYVQKIIKNKPHTLFYFNTLTETKVVMGSACILLECLAFEFQRVMPLGD